MELDTKIIIDRIKHLEDKLNWDYLSDNKYINYDIYIRYKDKPWNIYALLGRNILTINDINIFPDTVLTWKYISTCKSLSIEYILDNLDKPFNWHSISCNDVITIDDIEKNPNLPWDWGMISINKNINVEFIKKNLNKPWDILLLSCNNGLSLQDIIDNKDLCNWDWKNICDHHELTFEHILLLKDKNLRWYNISQSECINLNIVLNNMDLPWDWLGLSINKNISLEQILEHPELPWDWDYIICVHPNMTCNFLKEHYKKAKDLFYYYIITSKNLTYEDICYLFSNTYIFKDCPYEIWKYVIENPNVTFNDVLNNLDKKWDWINISLSNKITYNDIISNLDFKWYWPFLSKNDLLFEIKSTDQDYIEYTRKLLSVNRIKRKWFTCITNPEYKMCKKRLLNEFNYSLSGCGSGGQHI